MKKTVRIFLPGVTPDIPDTEFGDFTFTFNPLRSDYDWLAVYDEMPRYDLPGYRKGRLALRCPRERTILLTSEPVSIKHYNSRYVRQFGYLLTNRPDQDGHPRYRFGRGYYKQLTDHTRDELLNASFVKTKGLSAVCSAKRMKHTSHAARFELVSRLAAKIPDMDWYGWGVKRLDRKYDALDAYRYHVAVENHIAPGHWSEKISDALLCECLPFYAGDPALGEVLPPESFIPIPIDDPDAAVAIVKEAIAAGEYEKRLPAIREAKRLILTKYCLYGQLAELISSEQETPVPPADPAKPAFLESRRRIRRRPLAALEDAWWHLGRLLRSL